MTFVILQPLIVHEIRIQFPCLFARIPRTSILEEGPVIDRPAAVLPGLVLWATTSYNSDRHLTPSPGVPRTTTLLTALAHGIERTPRVPGGFVPTQFLRLRRVGNPCTMVVAETSAVKRSNIASLRPALRKIALDRR